MVAMVESELEFQTGIPLLCLDNGFDISHCSSGWFFAEDMLSRIESGDNRVGGEAVGSGHKDSVDVRLDHLFEVGKNTPLPDTFRRSSNSGQLQQLP